MALISGDRVRETTSTTGTGALTLLGAPTGCVPFSAACALGDTLYYCISMPGGGHEIGLGTYGPADGQLTRTTVYTTHEGATTPFNFPAGTKDVFITLPSAKLVQRDASGNVALAAGLTVGTTAGLPAGTVGAPALSVGATNTGFYRPATGTLAAAIAGRAALRVTGGSTAVNNVTVSAVATTLAPNIAAEGTDTNIGLTLTPKGTGVVRVAGPLTTTGAVTLPADPTAALHAATKQYVDGGATRSVSWVSNSWSNPGYAYDPGTTMTAFINIAVGPALRRVFGTLFLQYQALTTNAASVIYEAYFMNASNVQQGFLGSGSSAANASPYSYADTSFWYAGDIPNGTDTTGWYIQLRLRRDNPLGFIQATSAALVVGGI
jgi:hypothetical protein